MAATKEATKASSKYAKKAVKKSKAKAKGAAKHKAKENGKVELPTIITSKNAKLISPRSDAIDHYTIKRLIKENPRRAGTEVAKRWDTLKKGMKVSEFIKKGGKRATIKKYVAKGWTKLVATSSGD